MQPTLTPLYQSSTTLGIGLPNSAPEVEMLPNQAQTEPLSISDVRNSTDP